MKQHLPPLDGPSLLGLSNISVSGSMAINDTALTISRLETADPIDGLDLTVCPADDLLDGCKVNHRQIPFYCRCLFESEVQDLKAGLFCARYFTAVFVRPSTEEAGEAAASCQQCRRSTFQPTKRGTHTCGDGRAGHGIHKVSFQSSLQV